MNCHDRIDLQQQLTANRVGFEIAETQGWQLMKDGIMFRPGTEIAKICADVMVIGDDHTSYPPVVLQCAHSPYSESAADLGGP